MLSNPLVTVLMAVYNGERHLAEAIESILNQTFKRFEFIIIDDGSSDGSVEIIKSYHDRRIHFYSNSQPQGLIASLNRGIDLSSGQYIARMDAADISLPDRLKKQVACLDADGETGACGSWVKLIDDAISDGQILRYPTHSEDIKALLLFESALPHPATMIRQKILIESGLRYEKKYEHAEDFALSVKLAQFVELASLSEVVLIHRAHGRRGDTAESSGRSDAAAAIRREQLEALAIAITDDELRLHNDLSVSKLEGSRDAVMSAEQWLIKLKDANQKKGIYARGAFEPLLSRKWYSVCRSAAPLGLWAWRQYIKSPVGTIPGFAEREHLTLFASCLLKQLLPFGK
jgi:glycosyltransferase involved in cell wall biosynthesis